MFTIEKFEVKGNAESTAMAMVKAQGAKKKLGFGSYGTVYGSRDSDVVYKIGDATDNEGYLAFIKVLAKQKTQNPYFPKIYGVRFIKGKEGDYWGGSNKVFVVAMEKLKPLPNKMREVCEIFEEEVRTDCYSTNKRNADALLGIKRKVPKQLLEAFDALRTAYKSGDCSWDLHSGNFMVRGKQVVCTDPLC